MKGKRLCLLAILGLLSAVGMSVASAPWGARPQTQAPAKHASTDVPEATRERVLAAYGKLPLSFEANRGQTDEQVRFLSRGSGYSLFLTSSEAVLVLSKPATHGARKGFLIAHRADEARAAGPQRAVLRMKLVGAGPTRQVEGLEPLPGKVNYFIGNDPKEWHTNVPTYARVAYRDVYPGIDLLYYGTQRQLEYDFIVAPGVDPRSIILAFQGAEKIELDGQGELLLHTAGGLIRLHKPLVYQELEGVRQQIPGGYVLKGGRQVGFQVAAYDARRPLTIDPVLTYSTYLGGEGREAGWDIAVDAAGNTYVTGFTDSADFPTQPLQQAPGGGDAFVTKLNTNAAGEASLVYSTSLGGTGYDNGLAIAVDDFGNAYVTGDTGSSDFPTTLDAFQSALAGGTGDAFVTMLNENGNVLLYSTYLGGSGFDGGRGIGVDSLGNIYVTGDTSSTDFPTTTNALQATYKGADTFVTKLHPGNSTLAYSTYLGGLGNDQAMGIAVDSAGNAYVTGLTMSADFPTKNAFQPALAGITDTFVTKLDTNATGGASLVYSTYLGGTTNDPEFAQDIAVDSAGNAYVAGRTVSSDFPTTPGAFQTTFGGWSDAFVTKLNASGSALVYSTYLGGPGTDLAKGIAIDSAGSAYITGLASRKFPGTSPGTFGGGPSAVDAFVTKFNPAGSTLVYSIYLGGKGVDLGNSIAVDSEGNAYVTGRTGSTDFPTANAFQPALRGSSDAFVTKVSIPSAGEVTVTSISPNSVQAGSSVVVTITGSNFAAGASVTFENGEGPAPTASNVVVLDANTITTTVTAKAGGPSRNRVWDVVVTNPDGQSGRLVDGFTVTP